MARAHRLAVPLLFTLFPCMLGFKGCYFGNDEVPLGSNRREGGADAGADGEDLSSGATGGESGGPASGGPSQPGQEEPVFVLQSVFQFAEQDAAGGGANL